MSTVSKLMKGLESKYKAFSVLSPVSMIGEVLLETAIPLFMAKIIDVGIAGKDLPFVAKYGAIMVGIAIFSLVLEFLAILSFVIFGSKL